MKVSKVEDDIVGTVMLRCDDACTHLVVDKFFWGLEGGEKDISYNIRMEASDYYDPNTFVNRLRNAWKALTGKRISYNDIYIDGTDKVVEFRDKLTELINKES